MPPRFLHVANGTATTNKIAAAAIPGALSVWCDPLHEGPVPGDVDDQELLRLRARFLAGEDAFVDVARGLQQWRDVITNTGSYDELVLWYEHDVFDQVNLIQLLSWLHKQVRKPAIVSLIEIGSFPGRPRFRGLGELAPEEIASLLDARRPVSEARYALADRAWIAFRQPSPAMLDELWRADTLAMPFLAAALKRFLEDYPWTGDGLSKSERHLLQIAAAGPVDLLTAFPAMHEGETAYYITDLSLLSLLKNFSRCTPPLISVGDAALDANRMPPGILTITDDGQAVLGGHVDRIAAYGFDRWFGGVHMETGRKVWRWSEDQQRVV